MFIQVINLDGSPDRLAAASAQLQAQGLEFSRCPAVDGRGLPASELPRYSPWRARLWYGHTLTGAEVGCFLSHLRAAERFLETDHRLSLDLQDDIVLPENFRVVLEALEAELGKPEMRGWRLVNLDRQVKLPRDGRPVAQLGETGHQLCACYDFPASASALLWSRDGAARFLRRARWIKGTVDNFLRSDLAIWGGGYCVAPRLTRTSGPSVIAPDRRVAEAQRGGRRKRGWFRLRSKWRGEWRSAVGHIRGMIGIR